MGKKLLPLSSLFAMNGIIYGLNALYYCFIQIYLEKYHSPVSVGILLAIGPLVSIFAPIFWGMRADKAKYKNSVLLFAVVGSAAVYPLLSLNTGFWWLFAILTLLMFFMSPFGGLVDIITLEYTSANGIAYGPIRLSGTFVFGIIPMALSAFTERNINVIFFVYIVMAAVYAVLSPFMPKVKGHADTSRKIKFGNIFRDHRLMVIFAMIVVTQFAWGYYINFFPTYLTNGLGLSQKVWGVNVFVTVLGEVPFFLMFTQIFNRFGIKKVLLVGLLLSIARYAGLGLFTTSPLILATGLITGVSVTMFTYCGSVYINNNMAPEIKASSQTVMYAIGCGIPKTAAGLAGGFMTETIGVGSSMLFCSALSGLSLFLYFVVFARDKSPAVNRVAEAVPPPEA